MNRDGEEYLEASADRLFSIIEKKLKTSFIGALSSLENSYFSGLWGHGKRFNDLTQEEKSWRKVFDELRKTILDNGNKQIRDIDEELSEYEIKWLRKQYNLPVLETREDYERYKKDNLNGRDYNGR